MTTTVPLTAAPTAVMTLLFTDIVDSTAIAARVGDRRWVELLDRHDALVRHELRRWDGREVKSVGDGFLAVFPTSIAALSCAREVVTSQRRLGIDIRAGLHAGEVWRRRDDIAGLAVNIASRVVSIAGAGEVVVTDTVRARLAGSQLAFADRGIVRLNGTGSAWPVFAVQPGPP